MIISTNNDLISIIITVYNVEKYLRKCLDSVLAQTYRNMEIILVDDGSTDSSPYICDTYADKDARIRVIHKENEGAPRARKAGFEVSAGTYTSMIDADDWLEPDMIEILYRISVEQDVCVAACGRFEENGYCSKPVKQGLPAGRYADAKLEKEVFPRMIVNQEFFEWGIFPSYWDKLFRREAIAPYLLRVDDRIPMGNDAAGVYPALMNAKNIYIVEKCLYHYRQTDASMVRTFGGNGDKRGGFRLLYRSVLKELVMSKGRFNLESQWLEYVLFLMIPRADELYEGILDLDYLFPFPKVKKNSRVILYGMGLYGQRMYDFLTRTGFCQVVAAADQNYAMLQKKGLPVIAPEEINRYCFDAIVITMSFAGATASVRANLSKEFPDDRIHMIDKNLLKEERTLKAFGLL